MKRTALMATAWIRSRTIALAMATLMLIPGSSVLAQSRTQDGATAGGIAGAIIGGIIGHQNDEVPEGALIGGAVGAVAGGLLGRNQDQALARQRYVQQQAYYTQQQRAYAQQQVIRNTGISSNDLVNMSRSGLSEPLILSQLQTKGVQRRLEVSEIISLHQQGVSDNIIAAMQSAPLATQLSSQRVAASAAPPVTQRTYVDRPPVIVREQPVIYQQAPVVVERVYRPAPPVYYHRYHPRYHSGASIRIGF
ncbi:MAG: YMGG-like glycine zipper-containing protein [Planctomycetota bacterium]